MASCPSMVLGTPSVVVAKVRHPVSLGNQGEVVHLVVVGLAMVETSQGNLALAETVGLLASRGRQREVETVERLARQGAVAMAAWSGRAMVEKESLGAVA